MVLFLAFTSCSDDDNGTNPPEPEVEVTIVDAAQATAELSSLVAALQKSR